MSSQFLKAFEGKNTRVPVWFMRQAGRYLPAYQQLKKQYSLSELFGNPEIAADITVMPVEELNVDAAILFADILTLPQAMGIGFYFDDKKGPVLDIEGLPDKIRDFNDIPHISETIKLINQRLPPDVPLIGFAGSPFTVLTYLVEGGSSVSHKKTLQLMMEDPGSFHALMEILTHNTIRYYALQKKAGIKAFQLFDTWAGILRAADYAQNVLPYVQRIMEIVDIPSIYFARNSHYLLPLMDQTEADFLSVDHTVVIGKETTLPVTQKGIQGNFYNALLYADEATMNKAVDDILAGGKEQGKFIFNLSHGVFPDVKVSRLKSIVERVHAFSWS